MGCQALGACHKNRDGNWSPMFNLCRQVPLSIALIGDPAPLHRGVRSSNHDRGCDRRDAWVGLSPDLKTITSEPTVGKGNTINESEMALFFECMQSCAPKGLDTADIVREAISRQRWFSRAVLRGNLEHGSAIATTGASAFAGRTIYVACFIQDHAPLGCSAPVPFSEVRQHSQFIVDIQFPYGSATLNLLTAASAVNIGTVEVAHCIPRQSSVRPFPFDRFSTLEGVREGKRAVRFRHAEYGSPVVGTAQ